MSADMSLSAQKLGERGPIVGAQGLGCMGMSEFYGPSDDAESRATLEHALDIGITLIDTADMYGRGHNESLIGQVASIRRKNMTIATKFGFERRADDPDYLKVNNRPDYIQKCADASLRRLGVDVIDLYYMHRRDPDVPLAESIGAMADLVKAGKVRYLGLSAVNASELREAHAIHPIVALQSEWSVFSREVETSIVPTAAALGIAFVAYSPLGRGLLTGALGDLDASDLRNRLPRFAGESGRHNITLVSEIRLLAKARNVTPAQLALAWLHHQSHVHGLSVVPIPGTRKKSRLDENVRAATIELNERELEVLKPMASVVKGDRFSYNSLQQSS